MAIRRHLSAVPLVTALVLACFSIAAFAQGAKKSQSITVESAKPEPGLVGNTYTTKATASSGLPVEVNTGATPSTCSISGSVVTFNAPGTCQVDYNQLGNSEYEKAEEKKQFIEVKKRSQTVSFKSLPPSPATVGATYPVSASASSGLTPVITSGPSSVCTTSGSTVSLIGAGTCTVSVNQGGNAEYEAAPQAQQAFSVVKKSQTITVESSPPSPALVGETYVVKAKASSGLPVSVSSEPSSVCTATGTEVKFAGAGTCTIKINQAGNGEYEAAPQQQQSSSIAKRSQTITVESSPPSPALVGETYVVKAKASSGLPVTISAGPTATCTASAGGVKLEGAGTCTISINQAGNNEYEAALEKQQIIEAGKHSQTIAFTSSPPIGATVGGPTYEVKASGGASGNPVSFAIDPPSASVCSISGATVSFIGAGTCTVDARQEGTAEYAPAKEQQAFVIHAKEQTVGFTSSPPSPAFVGNTYIAAASATSGLTPSLSSATPSVCTVSGWTVSLVGAGICTIDATQGGDAQFAPAPQAQQSFTVSLLVSPAPPSGSSPPPAPIEQTRPVVVPNSNFKVLGASLSLATYAITFVEAVNDPGTFTWVLTFENGKFGVFAASAKAKKCKAGTIRLQGKCRPAKILFGRGSESVRTPGSVTFTVRPTRDGVIALRKAFKKRKGLPVTAFVTFQSSRGGQPITRVQSLIVKGRR
jgi:hypothetical protein